MCSLPDAAHVEVGDLHNLGEAIDTGGMSGVQLLLSDGTQSPHKLHNGFTVKLVTAPPPQHVACHAYIYLQLIKDPQMHRTGALQQTIRRLCIQTCCCCLQQGLCLCESNGLGTRRRHIMELVCRTTAEGQARSAPLDEHTVQLLLVNLLKDCIWRCSKLCCVPALASPTRVVQGSVMNGGEAVSCSAIRTCRTTSPSLNLTSLIDSHFMES